MLPLQWPGVFLAAEPNLADSRAGETSTESRPTQSEEGEGFLEETAFNQRPGGGGRVKWRRRGGEREFRQGPAGQGPGGVSVSDRILPRLFACLE